MGRLTLLLFMLGVLADHHDAAFTLDDLTLFTNGLYGRPYFHFIFLLLYRRSCGNGVFHPCGRTDAEDRPFSD